MEILEIPSHHRSSSHLHLFAKIITHNSPYHHQVHRDIFFQHVLARSWPGPRCFWTPPGTSLSAHRTKRPKYFCPAAEGASTRSSASSASKKSRQAASLVPQRWVQKWQKHGKNLGKIGKCGYCFFKIIKIQ